MKIEVRDEAPWVKKAVFEALRKLVFDLQMSSPQFDSRERFAGAWLKEVLRALENAE